MVCFTGPGPHCGKLGTYTHVCVNGRHSWDIAFQQRPLLLRYHGLIMSTHTRVKPVMIIRTIAHLDGDHLVVEDPQPPPTFIIPTLTPIIKS